MKIGNKTMGLMVLCVAAASPAMVSGQEAEPEDREDRTSGQGRLEEIIVTARRRSESIQDVPISIVSRSGEYLELSQVESLNELDRVVPGFMMKEYEGGGQSSMSLRGISTYTQGTAIDQSVGVVVDGVVIGRVGSTVSNFSDIERVEVLRGPQGTLFGKNSSGGLVHIITKDPSDEFTADVSFGYGSYNEVTASGAVSGPLTDTVSGRLSAFVDNRDGYIENIYERTMLSDDQQMNLRGKLLFEPRDGTRLKLGAYYQERSQKGRGQPPLSLGPNATPHERALFGDIAGPENARVNLRGYVPFDDNVKGINLTWDQAIGTHTLTSISSFQNWKWFFGRNAINTPTNDPVNDPATGLPIPPLPLLFEKFLATQDQDLWSQEFRLQSAGDGWVQYVVGAYINGDRFENGVLDFLLNVSATPNAPPEETVYVFAQLGDYGYVESLNYAGFGELDFRLTDSLTLTAGARWTHDEKDALIAAVEPPGWIPEFGIGIGPLGQIYVPFLANSTPGDKIGHSLTEEWSWRVGARWEPTAETMFYTTAARGFKGGGFNDISADEEPETIDPEIATQYEVGMKSQWLDDRLTTNLTIFHTDVDDFQAEGADTVIVGDPPRAVTRYRLQNVGKMRTKGAEFEIIGAPTEALTLEMSGAYIDANYVDFTGAACYPFQTVEEGCLDPDGDPETAGVQDLSGKRVPYTPEWSGTASATYGFALPKVSFTNFIRLDYAYRSEIQWDPALAPTGIEDSVGLLNLSFGLTSENERTEVVAFVKNLTDEFNVSGIEGGNGAVIAYLPPEYKRMFGITVNHRIR